MKQHLAAGMIALMVVASACDKGGDAASGATAAKTSDAKSDATKNAASKEEPKEQVKLGPLTKEQCEKICRKQNIECTIKGAPPAKNPESMLQMCSDACVMATGSPGMEGAAYVSHAQHACVDKADCDEYKKCRDAKERELKPK